MAAVNRAAGSTAVAARGAAATAGVDWEVATAEEVPTRSHHRERPGTVRYHAASSGAHASSDLAWLHSKSRSRGKGGTPKGGIADTCRVARAAVAAAERARGCVEVRAATAVSRAARVAAREGAATAAATAAAR
eukprot:6260592-Prymnesium_polylepis.1